MQKEYFTSYPTTTSIFIICVVLFMLSFFINALTGGTLSFNIILFVLGAENTLSIIDGQIWRIILSSFLHADLLHIALNMYSLWFLGRYIESFFGSKNLFVIFIYSSILGSLFSLLMGFLGVFIGLTSSEVFLTTVSVGASGGLFGLLGVLLSNRYRKDIYTPELPVDQNSLMIIIIINLVYGFLVPGIDNWAHVGGLIGGFGMGFFIKPTFGTPSSNRSLISELIFWITISAVILSFAAQVLYTFYSF